MMDSLKRLIPDLAAVLLFAAVSFAYFCPAVPQGRILSQHDSVAGIGAGREAQEYLERTGERTRWTNALFGGMPTYQMSPSYRSTDCLKGLERLYHLFLPAYVWYVFAMLLGFHLLLRAFGLPPGLSAAGAFLWAFSSYFFIIIAAGHIWKLVTLAYIPPTLAGMVWAYRGRYLAGGLLTAVFTALQVMSNHVQMSYYFLFVMLFMAVAFGVTAWREGRTARFLKATGVVAAAGLLGVCVNLSNLYHTYEYSKETTRGRSELTKPDSRNQTRGGLERDYITQWSYGVGETFSLLVPNVKGGASVPLAANERAMEKADPAYRPLYGSLTQYFGSQPMTAGPVYAGAFVMFLFVLGLFVVRGPLKWALLGATALSVLLSWGKNFMGLTNFFLDYVPMYDKFRAVSSALVMAEFTIPLLAVLALKEIVEHPSRLTEHLVLKRNLWKWWFLAGGMIGLLLCYGNQETGVSAYMRYFCMEAMHFVILYRILTLRYGFLLFTVLHTVLPALLLAVAPKFFGSDFIPAAEMQMLQNAVDQQMIPVGELSGILANLEEMRAALVGSDALRSLLVIGIGCALLGLYRSGRLRKSLFIAGITLLCLADMWQVNKRYLYDGQFVEKSAQEAAFRPTDTDKAILADTAPDYRVLNLAGNTFNENNTSYWHKSIGGYHAAKLRRYQELIDGHIALEMDRVFEAVSATDGDLGEADPSAFPVLNMLNTRYFILPLQGGRTLPVRNPHASGNAWFVGEVRYVDNADQEMAALREADPKAVAVVDRRFAEAVRPAAAPPDSSDVIRLTDYEPNRLTYEADSRHGGTAVFSEIYYPGWQAYVDGAEVPHGRADYVLRALSLPQGRHEVEFRFDPSSIRVTEAVAFSALALLALALAACLARAALAARKRRHAAR